MQYSTVQCSTVQHNAVQYSTAVDDPRRPISFCQNKHVALTKLSKLPVISDSDHVQSTWWLDFIGVAAEDKRSYCSTLRTA